MMNNGSWEGFHRRIAFQRIINFGSIFYKDVLEEVAANMTGRFVIHR